MPSVPRRPLSAALLCAALAALSTATARADDVPPAPSVFQGRVDPHAPGLKLLPGKSLAPPKVLELKTIIGDEGGRERREDSTSDVKFELQAEVLFPKDSAQLAGNSRIRAIADEIRKQRAHQVQIFGFTDNLGSHDHGLELSKQRADAVQKELAKYLDADVSYQIRGYAEDRPVAANDTEEGRAKNRRVEVTFPRAG
ncbi:OmpA family protein [Streptomyces sp. NPDC052396]|uniref:OmpA family protein n=1 Tax=Streptomyces sp. NPDC052396 TaxID=3365689 RepID=UPI0037D3DAAD